MTRQQLIEQIGSKKSFLCVGLDTDPCMIPLHLKTHADVVFEFNKQIIDATKQFCVAYKINTAFYEAMGLKGWESMQKTVDYIPATHLKIADAKRGDIGNTSTQYAKAFFEVLKFDAITVAPYMGEDSVRPFLAYEDKWTIVLGLTSNKGADDFQKLLVSKMPGDRRTQTPTEGDRSGQGFLYEEVIEKIAGWGTVDHLMFVTGATRATELEALRQIIPDHFLLVPGVGFQGGSLKEVSKYGLTKDCGLLVNASRAIIYAGKEENFAADAAVVAGQYQEEMKLYLKAL